MSDPCKRVGVEGEQCEKLRQVLAEASRPQRVKRAPSSYNLYVKACIKAKGGVKTFGEAAPLMRQCATEYKQDKAAGKPRYPVEMPATASAPERPLWKGRDLQAEWAALYHRVQGERK